MIRGDPFRFAARSWLWRARPLKPSAEAVRSPEARGEIAQPSLSALKTLF
jgi:hypothetical protein